MWIDRVGLMLSGMAALSFLPAVIGEARLLSFGQRARQFRMRTRNWLRESLTYPRGAEVLRFCAFTCFAGLAGLLIAEIVTSRPSSRGAEYAVIGVGLALYFWAGALRHVSRWRDISESDRIMFVKRETTLLYLTAGIWSALFWALNHYFVSGIGNEALRLLIFIAWFMSLAMILLFAMRPIARTIDSSPSLAAVVDSFYRWLLQPIAFAPALMLWSAMRSLVRGAIELTSEVLLLFSRSRNIQILALLAFLVGVTLQLLATF